MGRLGVGGRASRTRRVRTTSRWVLRAGCGVWVSEFGSSLRKPVLRELIKILGQQGIGDQGEDVANVVGEVLHQLVLLEVGHG